MADRGLKDHLPHYLGLKISANVEGEGWSTIGVVFFSSLSKKFLYF